MSVGSHGDIVASSSKHDPGDPGCSPRKFDLEPGGSGSYLPPEALSPWSDIITKYLNGTAPSQKRYWRSRSHRHRDRAKSSAEKSGSSSSRSSHHQSGSGSFSTTPGPSPGSSGHSGGPHHGHTQAHHRSNKHFYSPHHQMAQPIPNHHHYHQSNQLQQPVVYSPTPIVAAQGQGAWQYLQHQGGTYQPTTQQIQQQEYQTRLLIEAGEVQRRYSCLKSSGGSSAGSTGSHHGIKASGNNKADTKLDNPQQQGVKVVLRERHGSAASGQLGDTFQGGGGLSSPLADITHVSSPSSNGQNSPMASCSHMDPLTGNTDDVKPQQQNENQKMEMRPPSSVSQGPPTGLKGGVAMGDDVSSPLSVSGSSHSSLVVNPAASSNFFSLIRDEDLASVGSGAGDGANGEVPKREVDSIEYESILEAEENYKELVEREWQQSRDISHPHAHVTSPFADSSALLSDMPSAPGPSGSAAAQEVVLNPVNLLDDEAPTAAILGPVVAHARSNSANKDANNARHFLRDDELPDI